MMKMKRMLLLKQVLKKSEEWLQLQRVGFLRSFHSLFMWLSCKECLDWSLRLVPPTSNIESCSCIGVALHCNWLLTAVLRQCKRHAWKFSTVILFNSLSLMIENPSWHPSNKLYKIVAVTKSQSINENNLNRLHWWWVKNVGNKRRLSIDLFFNSSRIQFLSDWKFLKPSGINLFPDFQPRKVVSKSYLNSFDKHLTSSLMQRNELLETVLFSNISCFQQLVFSWHKRWHWFTNSIDLQHSLLLLLLLLLLSFSHSTSSAFVTRYLLFLKSCLSRLSFWLQTVKSIFMTLLLQTERHLHLIIYWLTNDKCHQRRMRCKPLHDYWTSLL